MKNTNPRLSVSNKAIIKAVDALIMAFGCKATGIGPKAVGVLGDARSVGIAVCIKFSGDADPIEISTLVINRVKGITRVLMDIS
jgi:GMP synthase PP-ATPase subunit